MTLRSLVSLAGLLVLVTMTAYAQDTTSQSQTAHRINNITVRSALERLAADMGVNYRVDRTVQGRVTMRHADLSSEDALHLLVASINLTLDDNRGVSTIRPAEQKPVQVGLTSGVGQQSSLTISCAEPIAIVYLENRHTVIDVSAQQVRLVARGDSIELNIGDDTRVVAGPVKLLSGRGSPLEITAPRVRHSLYRGALIIISRRTLTAVNELTLEDYVRGVIPTEVPRSFHPEAQKALVVAIRTYAVRNMGSTRHNGFDLCDGVHCQGYAGATRDAEWIDALVDETRGKVAVYEGKPISATYSTACGGATQNNEDAGFGSTPFPYLRSVPDRPTSGSPAADYCAGCPHHSWSVTLSKQELNRRFARLQSPSVGRFESLEFTDHAECGRVGTVVIRGLVETHGGEEESTSTETEHRMRGYQFRSLLGESVIKSTRMSVSVSPEGEYVIEGQGYGHGVGLCSFGANGMAKSCDTITYEDILKHYYTGIEIESVYD